MWSKLSDNRRKTTRIVKARYGRRVRVRGVADHWLPDMPQRLTATVSYWLTRDGIRLSPNCEGRFFLRYVPRLGIGEPTDLLRRSLRWLLGSNPSRGVHRFETFIFDRC